MSAGAESAGVPTADRGEALGGEAPGLFVRKSSGLVREMGWRDSLSVSLSGINPATVVALFSAVTLVFTATADLALPYLVAALSMIPVAIVYAQLVSSMPRSGGDFVYFGRLFHPAVGAAVGGAFLSFFALNLGTNSVFVGQLFLPDFMATAGDVFGSGALTDFSETLGTSKAAWMISASVIVLIGCLVAARGPQALTRVMFWCFVAGLLAVLILIGAAITHGNDDFQAAYDAGTASGAYEGVIAATQEAGIETGNTLSGFFSVLPFVALGFWGFTVANFPAGEIKRPGRTYLVATLGGLAVGALFLIVSWLAIKHLAGLEFLQSAAALNAADPDAYAEITGGASTLTQSYAGFVSSDLFRLVMSAGFAIGGLMFPLVMVLIVSRLLFALSFDRLLPSKLAEVSERSHAPIYALVLCAVVGVAFAALVIYSTGFVEASRNGVLVWATFMTLAGIAAAVLPYRRRDLFEGSPKVIDGRWFGVPPIVVIALLSTAVQGTFAYVAATNESISLGYDTGSILYLSGTVVLGIVLYVVSRAYLRRAQGIDVDLAMRELPPE
jgi:basic amino acid/polyamine antiporter, APA family